MLPPPQSNSLTIYKDDLVHLRRETALDGSWTAYRLECLTLEDPVLAGLCVSYEKKSEAIAALLEMVKRAEDCEESEGARLRSK
jgi:hypothetical protein